MKIYIRKMFKNDKKMEERDNDRRKIQKERTISNKTRQRKEERDRWIIGLTLTHDKREGNRIMR